MLNLTEGDEASIGRSFGRPNLKARIMRTTSTVVERLAIGLRQRIDGSSREKKHL